METKTTDDIRLNRGVFTHGNFGNKKWVAVDDLIKKVEWLEKRTHIEENNVLVIDWDKVKEAFEDVTKPENQAKKLTRKEFNDVVKEGYDRFGKD